jgi:release factor glutamine methyltransferase
VTEAWTTLRVLEWTESRFARAGIDSPRLEAQVLLAHALGCDRVGLYTSFDKPLGNPELGAYRELIRRRLEGESVAYLVGEKEFWSRPFAVSAEVLVPRPDTETLIEAVLDRREILPAGAVADVGTGSGAIAVTLALELKRPVVATDVSDAAAALARRNAERHGAAVEVRVGDLLEPLAGEPPLAAVVSNPPYVATAELEAAAIEVRREPRLALDGGADGLDLIRRLVAAAAPRLASGGLLAIEHGWDQGAAVRQRIDETGSFGAAETVRDLGGRERVTLAVRR